MDEAQIGFLQRLNKKLEKDITFGPDFKHGKKLEHEAERKMTMVHELNETCFGEECKKLKE